MSTKASPPPCSLFVCLSTLLLMSNFNRNTPTSIKFFSPSRTPGRWMWIQVCQNVRNLAPIICLHGLGTVFRNFTNVAEPPGRSRRLPTADDKNRARPSESSLSACNSALQLYSEIREYQTRFCPLKIELIVCLSIDPAMVCYSG